MDDTHDPELTHDLHPDDRRVVIRETPFNAEAGAPALMAAITPREAHYVRCNFDVPALDRAAHAVAVEGAVAERFALRADELSTLPQRSVTVTLECAGNQRLAMAPLPPGQPWDRGAVSTASWTGVPLALVLDRAGVRDDAVEILVVGADAGVPAGAVDRVPFARALPLDKARDPNVILAVEMNGAPLPIEHGAPARLVVPGWYGMASVKWVARIAALTEPFQGWFQSQRYVYKNGRDARPVDVGRVKSLLVAPEPNVGLARGRIEIWGWAWSGAAPIAGVDVALDDNEFLPAELDAPLAPHAWRRFALALEVRAPGRHTLRTRARDAAGRVQPDAPAWNEYGYGNNAALPTTFYVL